MGAGIGGGLPGLLPSLAGQGALRRRWDGRRVHRGAGRVKRGGRDPRRTPDPPPHGTAVTTGFRRVCLVIASLSTPLVAQDSSATGHFHVGLTVHDWGISIGNREPDVEVTGGARVLHDEG